jgi:putative ABC transport system substrate-binding protein
MKRRTFITALGGAAAWPLAAQAQQSGKIPKVGVLLSQVGNEQGETIFLGALRQGLNDLGYIEGKNIELLNRFAEGHYDRFDRLAAELLDAKVDVIVASIPAAALAAKRASTAIPVVLAIGSDYLAQGLAQSLAHPGGNVTGLSALFTDLVVKRLEILKDSNANLSAVGVLINPNNPTLAEYVTQVQRAADALRISVLLVKSDSPDDIEQGFSTIANTHVDAVIQPDPTLFQQRKRIGELALANRVPTIAWNAEMAVAGVLMSYGVNTPDLFRRAAGYIDKILKGANAADLPIEQPTKFEFVINLKTAKALNLAIPPSLLARADEVIE